jgi:hypothetical protein
MTSKIVVNNIEADAGVSTVTFGSKISSTEFVGPVVGNVTGNLISTSGVTTVAAGSTSAPSITPTGDSNTGIFFPSADTIAFAEGGAEALRIDSNANIGIGTINPPDKLTVLGKVQIQQDASSNNRLVLRGQPSSSYRWNIDNYSSSNNLRIFREDDVTSGSGAVYAGITSTGNFQFDSGYGSAATAYGCRAWISFDASSGTPTIEAKGNVSSITDHGIGQFTFNFTNSFPDANYCVVGMTQGGTSGIGDGGECARIGDRSTTSNYMSFTNSNESSYADNKRNCVLWMR